MYRLSSTAVWHSLPGVVAAYQPISAPNPIAARQNISANMQRLGLFSATPGVAPTWTGYLGWTFNGSSQYLTTNVIFASTSISMLVRYSGTSGDNKAIVGWYKDGSSSQLIQSNAASMVTYNGKGYAVGYCNNIPAQSTGVYGIAGKQPYRNGVAEATPIPAGDPLTYLASFIGAYNNGVAPAVAYFNGSIQTVAFYSRTLSPAEVWLASRQMAYCDVAPEFNAWAPRRSYFIYTTTAAAGLVGIYGPRHALGRALIDDGPFNTA